jgi:YesN/AraC family two-component response regulator
LSLQKKILSLFFFLSITAITNGQTSFRAPDSEIIAKYIHLSPQQLLDTGYYHYDQNNINEALTCFGLLINTVPKNADVAHQKILIGAYFRFADIHYHMDNYRIAYELLLKALQLSESIDDVSNRHSILISLGNIYHRLDRQDLAKWHFLEALTFGRDSVLILNNLGYGSVVSGNLDDAYRYLTQSMQLAQQQNSEFLYIVLHSMAAYYRNKKNYDSAYHYYQLTLNKISTNNTTQHQKGKAIALSGLGRLFFEINKLDSAVFYIGLSNSLATENDFLAVLLENYLMMSQIAEARGNRTASFEYFRQYSNLKDSIYNREKIVDITELRRLYEIAKANQQIDLLTADQQMKSMTIRHQRIIQHIMLVILITVSLMLAIMFFQHKRLNTAHQKLVEKNVKLIEFENPSVETHSEKYQKSLLTDQKQNELLTQIYAVMEDVSIVCNAEFSLDKLAELVQSNRVYVSQVINSVLKRNFSTLVNESRIREAQRLLLEMDTSKYTIDMVVHETGFKSRSTFNAAFKEISGVSPSFYLKSIQKL